jgi:hypothetical protein
MHAETEAARLDFEWKRSMFTILVLFDPEKLDAAPLLALGQFSSPSKSDQASKPPARVAAPVQQSALVQPAVYSVRNRSLPHVEALAAATTSASRQQAK